VRPIYRESSLGAAIDALQESFEDAVPILDGAFVAGVVWGAEIRAAALEGASLTLPISNWLDVNPPRALSNAPRSEARAILTSSGRPALVVVDPDARYIGMVGALDLLQRRDGRIRPPFIGGMATPFGVFLTNGDVYGGAGPVALIATGAMMALLLIAGVLVTVGLLELLGPAIGPALRNAALYVAPSVLFFTFLRALPISGTHGAEHMVVHAIERREPLISEVVRRMPRVHPRCGTNFAIGGMLFMFLTQGLWPRLGELGALVALVATLIFWRPLGAVFQKYVTTKTPSERQLQGAMAAGEELLQRFKRSSHPHPSFGKRLLMSGMPWVLIGSAATFVAMQVVLVLLDIDPAVLGLG
jgi:CBS domain-containing protein